jgi:hypothetical protein
MAKSQTETKMVVVIGGNKKASLLDWVSGKIGDTVESSSDFVADVGAAVAGSVDTFEATYDIKAAVRIKRRREKLLALAAKNGIELQFAAEE